jgi:thioredoxin 1
MSENIVHLTDDNFEDEVIKSDILTMIDFWAEWCGPCKVIAPVVDELAGEYNGKVKVGKLNVDNSPNVSAKYSIRGIPTLLFFKEGKVVNQLVGVQSKAAIKKVFDENI